LAKKEAPEGASRNLTIGLGEVYRRLLGDVFVAAVFVVGADVPWPFGAFLFFMERS